MRLTCLATDGSGDTLTGLSLRPFSIRLFVPSVSRAAIFILDSSNEALSLRFPRSSAHATPCQDHTLWEEREKGRRGTYRARSWSTSR